MLSRREHAIAALTLKLEEGVAHAQRHLAAAESDPEIAEDLASHVERLERLRWLINNFTMTSDASWEAEHPAPNLFRRMITAVGL